jgi:hypothetical protein
MGEIYISMANDQDRIGWWWFMERMVCKKIRGIQEAYAMIRGCTQAHRDGQQASS